MAIKREFPYVRVFNSMEGWGFHFFASLQPFEMPSVNDFVRRLPETAIEDLIEWNKDRGPAKIYQEVIEKEVPLKKILTQDATFSITDDRPFNEYFLLRRLRLRLSI